MVLKGYTRSLDLNPNPSVMGSLMGDTWRLDYGSRGVDNERPGCN